jgi:hypothetical protein
METEFSPQNVVYFKLNQDNGQCSETIIVGIYLVYQSDLHVIYKAFSVISIFNESNFLEILLFYVTGKEETFGSH